MNRTIALGGLVAVFGFLPAAATAAPPPIQCGIVSCTYPVERKVEAVRDCLEGAGVAIREVLEGTPQPQECSLG